MTFYFTYGFEGHPHKGGWTEVIADSFDEAVNIFNVIHPTFDGCGVNCSMIYSEERFKETTMYTTGNQGKRCLEKIELKVTKIGE